MKNTMNWEMGTKIAKLFVIVVAVYLGMKFIFPIVLPFLIGFLFAGLLYPLAKKIEKKTKAGKSVSRTLAYGIFLLIIAGIMAGALYFCYRMGSNCLEKLTYFRKDVEQLVGNCCIRLEQISGFSTDEIQSTLQQETEGFTGGAMEYSKDAGWYLFGLLAKVFVTFVATLLILNDYERIIAGITGTPVGKRTMEMFRDIKTASGAYVRAQLCIIGLVMVVCIGGLFLLKTPHALGIGIAIGLCDALPFLGTGTVFVPWALIELLLGGYGKAAGYFVLYLICSFIRQILEPRLVGERLGFPPLAVLMSIYIGIQVYGTAGVILGPISALLIYEIYHSTFQAGTTHPAAGHEENM